MTKKASSGLDAEYFRPFILLPFSSPDKRGLFFFYVYNIGYFVDTVNSP